MAEQLHIHPAVNITVWGKKLIASQVYINDIPEDVVSYFWVTDNNLENSDSSCNICRSPIAEAVFRKLVTDQKLSDHWRIDSAATSTYEIGNPPDYRGQSCMKKHGIPMNHTARQVTKEDFATFDYILCMDESNLRDLNRKSNQIKNCKAKIELLGSYDPQNQRIIEDPYYGNESDFETVYQQCVRCCKAFLDKAC